MERRIVMENNNILKKCERLVRRSLLAVLTTLDKNNVPNTRALLKAKNEGISRIWLTTNTSSRKVNEIKENTKRSVYFYTRIPFRGITLQGNIRIVDDMEQKQKFWRKSYIQYYKQGVTDPDYTLLCFETETVTYYFNQRTETIKL